MKAPRTPEQRAARNAYIAAWKRAARADPEYRAKEAAYEAGRRRARPRTDEQRVAKAAADARYRAEHVAEAKARAAAYYAAHRDEIKARASAYNRAHPEVHSRACRTFRARHGDEIQAANAVYRAAHPDVRQLSKARRWVIAHAAEGKHSRAQWRERLASNGGRCAWCFSARNIERDHVIPLTRGGTDFIENVVPACHACNSGKRNLLVQEWFGQPA